MSAAGLGRFSDPLGNIPRRWPFQAVKLFRRELKGRYRIHAHLLWHSPSRANNRASIARTIHFSVRFASRVILRQSFLGGIATFFLPLSVVRVRLPTVLTFSLDVCRRIHAAASWIPALARTRDNTAPFAQISPRVKYGSNTFHDYKQHEYTERICPVRSPQKHHARHYRCRLFPAPSHPARSHCASAGRTRRFGPCSDRHR